MWKPNGMIAIVALFALSQPPNASAAMKSLHQSYSYPQKHVMYNEYALKEGNLAFAVCDGIVTEKTCSIVQHQFPDEKVSRTCNVTLKVKHPENVHLTSKISVQAFGRENAILFWGEVGSESTFNLMAIRMNDCTTRGLQLDDPHQKFYFQQRYAHKLVTYDDDFDIFFQGLNSSHPYDGTQLGMRVSFDEESRHVFDINNDNEDGGNVRFISPIATSSPDKGFAYFTTNEDNYDLWLVKPDGTKKFITSYENQMPGTSVAHDAITLCADSEMDYSHTTCTQYDENGDIVFNVTLHHDDKSVTLRQALHSSPFGGFLLMTTSLEISDDPESNGKPTSSEVIRVDGEGKKVGSVRLDGFVERLDNAETSSIWDNGDEYCAALIGQEHRDTSPADNLDIVVNCFTEDDFTA